MRKLRQTDLKTYVSEAANTVHQHLLSVRLWPNIPNASTLRAGAFFIGLIASTLTSTWGFQCISVGQMNGSPLNDGSSVLFFIFYSKIEDRLSIWAVQSLQEETQNRLNRVFFKICFY